MLARRAGPCLRGADYWWMLVAGAVATSCGGRAINCYVGDGCGDALAPAVDEPSTASDNVSLLCPDGEVQGPLSVASQAELDALQGCERVVGDLSVLGFSGASLLPLSSLREVTGTLSLGGPLGGEGEADAPALTSLDGLEQLEAVGDLYITLVAAPSLEALSSLRTIGSADEGGALRVSGCNRLRDFRGFGGSRGITSYRALQLSGNTLLESLEGLPALPEVEVWSLGGNPQLTHLQNVPARITERLSLWRTFLTDMTSFAALREVGEIDLFQNPRLESLRGLERLQALTGFHVSSNPSLRELARMEDVTEFGYLSVTDNPELLTDVSFPNVRELRSSRGSVTYENNPRLERIAGLRNLTSARRVIISHNESLREVELPSLSVVVLELEVTCNPVLENLDTQTLLNVDSNETRLEFNGFVDRACEPPPSGFR